MNINLYLPDDVGQRAKDEQLPFSQLLREAVLNELERRETMKATLKAPETYEVYIENDDGRGFTGRITGASIAYDDRSEVEVFLTADERVLVYDGTKSRYYELVEPVEDLRNWLPKAAYADAVTALGQKPIIDL
jgi:hypothetical protein